VTSVGATQQRRWVDAERVSYGVNDVIGDLRQGACRLSTAGDTSAAGTAVQVMTWTAMPRSSAALAKWRPTLAGVPKYNLRP
jgi:hypothetical protein